MPLLLRAFSPAEAESPDLGAKILKELESIPGLQPTSYIVCVTGDLDGILSFVRSCDFGITVDGHQVHGWNFLSSTEGREFFAAMSKAQRIGVWRFRVMQ